MVSPAFYVSPSGSDGNNGSISAPFLTFAKAQAAMQASSTKTTYVRAGTYAMSSALALRPADSGESWDYYPPDGVDSAVLDGGSTLQGGLIAIQRGTSNITINGLKIQNFVDYGIIGAGSPQTGNNTVENCDVGFNTATTWNSAGITLSGPNTIIANNYVHDVGSQGIASYAYFDGQTINGTVIKNNVVLRAVQRMSDGGAIYVNMHSGIQTDYVTITNNYVAEQGSASTWGVTGIYLDDLTSNAMVRGNVIGPPAPGTGSSSNGPYGTVITAFVNNSGNHNTISGNLVDLGSSGTVMVEMIAWDKHETSDVGMHDDTFVGNIVISNFAGSLKALVSGVSGYAYFQSNPSLGQDPLGSSYTVANNIYWNFAFGGSVFSNGTVISDSNPIVVNPQISGWDYTIAASSPAFTSAAAFAPISGGFGPPGFSIPESGAAPSSPH